MNLTCSPEPYSAVRNANVDLVNYKRGKLFKYWKERGEKNSAGSPCSRVGAFCVMKFVSVLCSRLISLHLKAYMLHYERWLMQSQLRLVLVGALNSSLPLSLSLVDGHCQQVVPEGNITSQRGRNKHNLHLCACGRCYPLLTSSPSNSPLLKSVL